MSNEYKEVPVVDLLTPREGVLRTIRERLDAAMETVKGGTRDGESVVTKDQVAEVLADPLPPASDHGAEAVTPARIVVSAECPKCGLPATIALLVSSELRVDSQGSTLRLKGKSKETSHTCGQTTLFDTSQQQSFDLSDIIGPDDEGIADEAP